MEINDRRERATRAQWQRRGGERKIYTKELELISGLPFYVKELNLGSGMLFNVKELYLRSGLPFYVKELNL